MREVIIRWGFFPNEIRQSVRPILLQYLWLLPSWCRLLNIRYGGQHESGAGVDAMSSATDEYRFCHITVFAPWLASNATQRRLDIVHELLHIPVAPMVIEHDDVLERLFADGDAPKFKSKLDDCWRRAFEQSVQDLTYSILALPENALPVVPFREEEDAPPPPLLHG